MNPLIDMRALRARRLRLVLVVDRQVVEDVFTTTVHAVHAAANQCRHLIGERWVVRCHMRMQMRDQL